MQYVSQRRRPDGLSESITRVPVNGYRVKYRVAQTILMWDAGMSAREIAEAEHVETCTIYARLRLAEKIFSTDLHRPGTRRRNRK